MAQPDPHLEPNRQGFAAHNVTGTFPDMDGARRAIGKLENAGIDSSLISLIGPGPSEAADATDTRQRDLEATTRVGKKAVTGAAAGSAIGGGIGFLAGLAAFAVPGVGSVLGTGVWAATVGGAVAGGGVGGVVGGVAGVETSDAWELTFQNVRAGRVTVGVHADDPQAIDKAAGALDRAGATGLHRFDARGRTLR